MSVNMRLFIQATEHVSEDVVTRRDYKFIFAWGGPTWLALAIGW